MTGLPRPFGLDVSLFRELSKCQNWHKSKDEARRLIGEKAVKVDGQIVSDVDFEFRGGVHRLVEVGKTRIAQASGE